MKATGRKEAPPEYYDRVFTDGRHYQAQDYKSFKGFTWWKRMADRFEGIDRVIDLGSGPGYFAQYLHDLGISYYLGVDFSLVAVERGEAWAWEKDLDPDYSFLHADLYEAIDQSKESISDPGDVSRLASPEVLVTSLATLEHLDRDRELLEVLPAGTHFLGLVPSIDSRSHVRFFERPRDVRQRYGHLFDDLTVTTYRDGRRRVYVFEGIRSA